ncbi:MAG TPA: hypothetical protein VGO47_13450, partial [Chlamydiales bacterium]|nr:hypothetical protein [Chlamydiales bacterium]
HTDTPTALYLLDAFFARCIILPVPPQTKKVLTWAAYQQGLDAWQGVKKCYPHPNPAITRKNGQSWVTVGS